MDKKKGEGGAILNRVVRKGFTGRGEKALTKVKGGAKQMCGMCGENILGRASLSTNMLRRKHVWCA